MPLVRFEVRNEFGLGDQQLYRAPQKKDDPKAILDGVAVAGLVGILRQLGDLAELASDIFQDLHEQVTVTSVRGRKLLNRIHQLETALPSYENAIREQRSHIHFAYVPGSDWHSDAKMEESHLLASDLPRFMMDSYEECQDPPRLYLLDKFDSAGPGACLKRYSDPSYFKRVWATMELEKAENIQREKKAQKIKKKRSTIQLAEVQHDVSSSRRYGSTRFASPDGDDQQYSTEDEPISDMNLKPELASRSTSLGSVTMLNNTEQLPEKSPSGVSIEHELDRFSGSDLQIDQSGSFASDVHDKINGVSNTYYGFPHGSLKEDIAYRSPYVTWDEKTEILKPGSPRSCDDIVVDDTQHLEPLPVSSLQSNVEPQTAVMENLEQENIIFSTANIPAPLPSANYFDDIANETDHYMDALNTLESEAETDSECQTKREVKSFPNFSYSQMEPETSQIQEAASPSSVFSGAETASGSYSFTNEDESPITVLSETLEPVEPPQETSPLPDPKYSIGNQLSENNAFDLSRGRSFEASSDNQPPELGICTSPAIPEPRTSDPESTIHNQSSEQNAFDTSRCSFEVTKGDQPPDLGISTSPAILDPRAADMSKSSGSSPLTISSFPSAKFWTNGVLLGLAPSKPPDFSTLNVTSKDFVSDYTKTEGLPNASLDLSSPSADPQFGRNDNMVSQVNLPQSSPSYPDNQDGSMPVNHDSKRQFPVLSSSYPEKIQMVMPTSANAQNGFDVSVPRASEFPCSSVDSQPNESGQSTIDISSSFSALAQRILANSLQRRPSIAHAESVAGSTDSSKLNDSSLNNQNEGQRGIIPEEHYPENISNVKQFSSKNSISSHSRLSGHSSPPLEHMKISFHPMNGLDTSKLKLEYAGANFSESIEDVRFPSFQLLPRPHLPSGDNVSETDDDTFCRSCPCTSEDHLSPRSDSNSELWDQDDMSGENHHDIYNDLHGISLSSSVSSFKGFDHMNQIDLTNGFDDMVAENNVLYFQDGNSVGLPGLDSFISTSDGLHDPLSAEVYSSQTQNKLPPPPPLPPMQWRATKASVDKEEKDPSVAEIVEHFNILQAQRCTASKQQEQNIPRPPAFPEKMACSSKNAQKPKGQIDLSHAPKNNESDMKEMLLHQFKNLHHGQKLNGHKETGNNDTKSEQLDGREGLLHQIRNKFDQEKVNGHQKPHNPCVNSEEVDEREELLHQIRNKSFNLRHTSTTRSRAAPQSTTNINVSAILEKANAIRQAFVGSDDGGDGDNWSDG